MGCCFSRRKAVFDPLGTPMPDSPKTHKSKRSNEAMGKVGYGSLGGLEREASNRRVGWGSNTKGVNPEGQRKGQEEGVPLLVDHSAGSVKVTTNQTDDQNRIMLEQSAKSSKRAPSLGQLTDKYELKEVLGVGSTSTCHRCISLQTQKHYACKIIDKRHIESRFRGLLEQFHVEIEVLKELQHPNIISLEDVYVTSDKIYMVMELMGGGELFDYVVEKGTLTEEEASGIVRKVTSAVVYMHGLNIIHRDLKPENLLLTHRPRSQKDTPEVKIIDFGLSKFLNTANTARSFLGTRGYLAPEMLQRRDYNKAVDVWALGVIVFVLLCGCLPFDDDSAVPTDAAVKEKFVLRFPRWARNLSDSAKDLLMHLLDCDPRTRYTAEQALAHPWVTGRSVKIDNYLQSPKVIRTPRTPAGGGKVKSKDKVAELLKVRKKEGSAIKGKSGNGGGIVRKNSI